ncbi:MAG: 3'-5' exonuclease [Propionibacteriaceae bacterium]|jgi:DNA polymerase-3 subunit epsilon|nr:3'-5' exonuclease [Propionibacteriaceae bacterium]
MTPADTAFQVGAAAPAAPGTAYAVIDTETTGFGSADRVIEIGVVLLDARLAVEGEWDTLVNPGCRSLGPTSVHRITAADVAGAPAFADIAGRLVALIRGRVLVGHNIGFDARMVNQEFERLGAGRPVQASFSLDTVALTRAERLSPTGVYTLDRLCACLGIDRQPAHAALADARATVELLARAAACLARRSQAEGTASLWPSQAAAAQAAAWPVLPDAAPAVRLSRLRP